MIYAIVELKLVIKRLQYFSKPPLHFYIWTVFNC